MCHNLKLIESFRSKNEDQCKFVCLVIVQSTCVGFCDKKPSQESCCLPGTNNEILRKSLLDNKIYEGEFCASNSRKITKISSS